MTKTQTPAQTVSFASLDAVAVRSKDEHAMTVSQNGTVLGTLTVRDTFGHDAEFTPADRHGWQTYQQIFRDTPYLARTLREIAEAPRRLTTPEGFRILVDMELEQMHAYETFEGVGIEVAAGKDTDRHAAVDTALDGYESETAPSVVLYVAEVDGVMRLVRREL